MTVTAHKDRLESIVSILSDVTETAGEVNRHSHSRRKFAVDSLGLIKLLIEDNIGLKQNYEKIYKNLNDSLLEIEKNSREFRTNVENFSRIITNINTIKDTLDSLDDGIGGLKRLVEEIRNDTDEIFTLALNASIVSSKYSHTSGVFDILAEKLNEMSNFINTNLENIVEVVRPITNGINKLTDKNALVLTEIEDGLNNLLEFPDILDASKESIDELLLRLYMSSTKIEDQKKLLDDIQTMVRQMDNDAAEAIDGSGNVMASGSMLIEKMGGLIEKCAEGSMSAGDILFIHEEAGKIRETASNVNTRSISQLEFSMNSVDFCDSIIAESSELKKITEKFNTHSSENNIASQSISKNLGELTSQLKMIEKNIGDSNRTIHQFNEDYRKIDNIIEFLKNILKSMNVIGMYSRIESARDPEEFQGFTTISDNISDLQEHIQKNIPMIEDNISSTHEYIDSVNRSFENISTVFQMISGSSGDIIERLNDITVISSESEKISKSIMDQSNEIEEILAGLRKNLTDLSEVVRLPIDGSGRNIERGRNIEDICGSILEALEAGP